MTALRARRIRLGVVAFLLTGFLSAIGLLLRGANAPAAGDAAAWAEAGANATHHLGWVILVPGPVFQIFAFLAIWAGLADTSQEKLAFRGAMLSIAGNGLYLPFLGLSAFLDKAAADSYLAGNTDAVEIVRQAMFGGAGIAYLGLSAIILVVGVAMTSVAVWRSGLFPKWVAVTYLLQAIGLTIAAQYAYAVELTGGFLLLLSSIVMGGVLWRRAGELDLTSPTSERATTG